MFFICRHLHYDHNNHNNEVVHLFICHGKVLVCTLLLLSPTEAVKLFFTSKFQKTDLNRFKILTFTDLKLDQGE